jgi:hypothetical protein
VTRRKIRVHCSVKTNSTLKRSWSERSLEADSWRMLVKLTVGEIKSLNEILNRQKGCGGFQNLIRHVWYHLDENTGELHLSHLLMERIHRYAFEYRNAYWRCHLRKVFRRTLGINLNRGLLIS